MLGISGASGAAYALRLLEQLLLSGAEVHLVVTEYGRRLLFDEEKITHLEFATLCPTISDSRLLTRLDEQKKLVRMPEQGCGRGDRLGELSA